jgi:cation transport ATPase
VAWYATPTVNYALVGVTLLLCISTLISFGYHRKERKEDPTLARWCARTAAALSVLTVCGAGGVIAVIAAVGEELVYGMPKSLAAVLWLVLLATILTPVLVWLTGLAWRNRWWTTFRRVHVSLFALAALGMVWFYVYWHLLGWQY